MCCAPGPLEEEKLEGKPWASGTGTISPRLQHRGDWLSPSPAPFLAKLVLMSRAHSYSE